MLSQFLRTVGEARPNGFLFENVESLLHPTNKHVMEAFLEAAEALGYRCMRIPLILISHSGRSRSPIPVILITLFTMPEEGTADSMTWRWTATTDG
jgi:hypothetical protein